jgi:type III restriction enzyme
MKNLGKDVFALTDTKAEFDYDTESNIFQLSTRETIEKGLFSLENDVNVQSRTKISEIKIVDLGKHIIRTALSRIQIGRFDQLIKIFGNIESIDDFISNEKYLGEVKVKIKGTEKQLKDILQSEKLEIASFVIDRILESANKERKEYSGTKEFIPHLIQKIFENDKVLQIDSDSPRAQNMRDFDFANRD